eukprot:661027-Pyramimonas_sp.AAC.1
MSWGILLSRSLFICGSGETTIDCVVCSRVLYPYLTVVADLTSPFETHARLDVVLDVDALVGPVCQGSKPREIPEAMCPDDHWLTCMAQASSSLLEAPPFVMPEDRYSAFPEHAVYRMSGSLGKQYLARSRALALQALSRARAVVDDAELYRGRGSMLKRKGKSLMTRGVQAQIFRNPDLSYWSLVSA